MACVFDTPVSPNGTRKSLDVHVQTADVIADFKRLLAVANAYARHHTDRLQSFPERETRQARGSGELKIRSTLFASMTLLCRCLLASIRQVPFKLFVDVIDDRFVQRFLVPLQCQDV